MSTIEQLLPQPDVIGDLDHDRTATLLALRQAYAYPDPLPPGGWLRAIMISSLDGSAVGPDSRSGGLGNPADVAVLATLRGLADVVLVGSTTAEVEGYRLPEPHPVFGPLRQAIGQPPAPALAVLSRRSRTEVAVKLGIDPASERFMVFNSDAATAATALNARGLGRIVLEGGPSVLGGAVTSGALAELCLTISPALVGGTGPRIAVAHGEAQLHLTRPTLLLFNDGLLLGRWQVEEQISKA